MPETTTLDAVREVAREVLADDRLGVSTVRKILAGYRVTMIPDLHPRDYRAVYAALRKAQFLLSREKKVDHMPPLKVQMMLHFATLLQPFAPEQTRRSEAYVTYVRELLRDGMIERPTAVQREAHAGWAYKATPRGQCYVKAITATPLPVRTNPEWSMPAK